MTEWKNWPSEKPKKIGYYLIAARIDSYHVGEEDKTEVSFGYWDGLFWEDLEGIQLSTMIYAWAPLPPPPEEERK